MSAEEAADAWDSAHGDATERAHGVARAQHARTLAVIEARLRPLLEKAAEADDGADPADYNYWRGVRDICASVSPILACAACPGRDGRHHMSCAVGGKGGLTVGAVAVDPQQLEKAAAAWVSAKAELDQVVADEKRQTARLAALEAVAEAARAIRLHVEIDNLPVIIGSAQLADAIRALDATETGNG